MFAAKSVGPCEVEDTRQASVRIVIIHMGLMTEATPGGKAKEITRVCYFVNDRGSLLVSGQKQVAEMSWILKIPARFCW